jgi:hypothetical protein
MSTLCDATDVFLLVFEYSDPIRGLFAEITAIRRPQGTFLPGPGPRLTTYFNPRYRVFDIKMSLVRLQNFSVII